MIVVMTKINQKALVEEYTILKKLVLESFV